MNNAVLMDCAECFGNLHRNPDGYANIIDSSPGQNSVERFAFDKCHYDVGLTVCFAGVVDRTNVCVANGRCCAGFTDESLREHPSIAGHPIAARNLDGNASIQLWIVSLVDVAHGA